MPWHANRVGLQPILLWMTVLLPTPFVSQYERIEANQQVEQLTAQPRLTFISALVTSSSPSSCLLWIPSGNTY